MLPIVHDLKWIDFGRCALLPKMAYDHPAAFDLSIPIATGDVPIAGQHSTTIMMGIGIVLPLDYMMQIAVRSSIGMRKGLVLLNAPAIIDPDYRGELSIALYNTTPHALWLHPGDAIVQAYLVPRYRYTHTWAQAYESTKRGANGIGSSGV